MGNLHPSAARPEWRRRWPGDLLILLAAGLLLAFLGAFFTWSSPAGTRYLYWIVCLAGGGLIAIVADDLLLGRGWPSWIRVIAACLLATPPASLYVLIIEYYLGIQVTSAGFVRMLWQVLPILLAVLGVRALAWRPVATRVENRILVAPPLPNADAKFRLRLSGKLRYARLIAVEAQDHYLKVHTDAGSELIALRFRDAVHELGAVHGFRVHRSWWIAADAILAGKWRRNVGELQLAGGLRVPVSRSYAPLLRAAGWF